MLLLLIGTLVRFTVVEVVITKQKVVVCYSRGGGVAVDASHAQGTKPRVHASSSQETTIAVIDVDAAIGKGQTKRSWVQHLFVVVAIVDGELTQSLRLLGFSGSNLAVVSLDFFLLLLPLGHVDLVLFAKLELFVNVLLLDVWRALPPHLSEDLADLGVGGKRVIPCSFSSSRIAEGQVSAGGSLRSSRILPLLDLPSVLE